MYIQTGLLQNCQLSILQSAGARAHSHHRAKVTSRLVFVLLKRQNAFYLNKLAWRRTERARVCMCESKQIQFASKWQSQKQWHNRVSSICVHNPTTLSIRLLTFFSTNQHRVCSWNSDFVIDSIASFIVLKIHLFFVDIENKRQWRLDVMSCVRAWIDQKRQNNVNTRNIFVVCVWWDT